MSPDGPDPAEPGAGRPSSSRWAWVVLLVSVLVLAVTVPIYRSRSAVRTRVSVVTVTPSAPAPRECDVGFAGCSVVGVRPTTLAAVRKRFPGSPLDSYGLSDNRYVDTEFVEVRTANAVLVSVQSHCGGGAGTVPDRHYGSTATTGPADEVFVAGGVNGCSVAVTIDVPAGVVVPRAAAQALAHDPVLKLV